MRLLLLVTLQLLMVVGSSSCQSVPADLPYPSVEEQKAAFAKRANKPAPRLLDSLQLINDLRFLASDSCEGRRPGTAGHALAMQHILNRFRTLGLDSLQQPFVQPFASRGQQEGMNIVGWVKGTKTPDSYIVVSAHYDHLGKRSSGQTFYGADDNASGAAALLAIAKYIKANPLPYSVVFAAFDKEESGLEGAYAFVKTFTSKVPVSQVKLNLNMDMVARSDNNEIYACGVKHTPALKSIVQATQLKTSVQLLMGHDYGHFRDDWTTQSDHNAFYKQGIPFIYIGVEDHEDYHKPSDTFDKVEPSRFIENCNMILQLLKEVK